jgi:lipopolysaccharide export system protein LptA
VSPAGRLLLAAVLATPLAWPAAAEPAPASATAPVPGVDSAPPPQQPLFDLGWDAGKPISIHSDELEYVQGKGQRRLLFRNNVSVEQDGLTITSARLEAFYPPNGNQPDRLVAEGDVRLAKGERQARCARAVYERAREVLICEGHAELQQGENRLSGDVIEIDLASDRLRVRGAASVTLESGLVAGRDGDEAKP